MWPWKFAKLQKTFFDCILEGPWVMTYSSWDNSRASNAVYQSIKFADSKKKPSLDMTGCKNAFLTLAILAFHSVTLRGLNCMHNMKLFRLGSFKQYFRKDFSKDALKNNCFIVLKKKFGSWYFYFLFMHLEMY